MKARRQDPEAPRQEPQRVDPLAFPYKRFSSPSQGDGNSIRRQNALAVTWSERTGVLVAKTVIVLPLLRIGEQFFKSPWP